MTSKENRGNQGRRTPTVQLNLIARLRREGHSVPAIQEHLGRVFGTDARGERTIQNVVKAIDENRVPWNRLGTDGADAKLVFGVLAEVIKASKGQKRVFTQEEAYWVGWVQNAAPSLPPHSVWLLACLYMNETRVKPETAKDFAQFDAFLALKPWESLDAMIAYDDMCQEGLIPQGDVMVAVAANARRDVYIGQDSESATDEIPGPLGLLAQLGTRGLPIDEEHSSLGMVYTNQDDDEEVKED